MPDSKTSIAYQKIKEEIIQGKLPPQSDISEEVLQKKFHFSRTPIHEALQLLQQEGFVHIYPRKGIFVSDISVDLVSQIFELRSLLEPYIAQQAIGKIPDEVLIDLKNEFLSQQEFSNSQEQLSQAMLLDEKFHDLLLSSCTNRLLYNMMAIVHDHEKRLRRLTYFQVDNSTGVSEHVHLIDCLLNRDEEQLVLAMKEHISISKVKIFSSRNDTPTS